MAERQAQRRFLALKVGEVSLVDSPANEQEFIVVKRKEPEEINMSDVAKSETNTAPAAPVATEASVTKGAGAGAEVVPVEVNKSSNADVTKALQGLEKLTETIAKMVGAQPAAASVADIEKAKKQKEDDDMMEDMRKALGEAGLKGDELEKTLKGLPPWLKDKIKPGKKDEEEKAVKKASDSEAIAEAEVAKTLEGIAAAIQKAKTFTPKREKALKGVVEELSKLLGELTQPMAHGTDPAVTLPSGTMYASGLTDVKKALEELTGVLKASFTDVATTTKALGDRLEGIEKARNPSQSVAPEGGTDKQVTKSFWGGVL